jgi:hypothetical protein
MATEEKKPETEAARAQPTPSSSATQSKVRARAPWEPLAKQALEVPGGVISSLLV